MVAIPGKRTHQQTRAHNAALVLRVLYDHGPVSRAHLARMTGLTRTTVGELIGELLDDGLAREAGRGPSTGGKAPIMLELVDGARHVIGLDLGESVFRAALLDLRGQVQRTIERNVEGLDGDRWLEVVHELIDELSRDAGPTLLGIGVGTPGIVDATTGNLLQAVNLDWQDLPLGEILRRRHGVPVEVANDSRAAALAVELFSGQRHSNLIAIKVGLGVGAGIVLNGELFHGDRFGAGEIGHVVVEDAGGAACRCGRFGCLETVASSRAILAGAESAAASNPDGFLGRRLAAAGPLHIEDVRDAVEAGDDDAHGIVVSAGRALGRALAGVIGVLDVEHVVLHGSVATMGPPWLDAVREEARQRSLALLAKEVSIELAPPIGDLVVMGASALLLSAELGLVGGRAA